MLDNKKRYLQLAINYDLALVREVLHNVEAHPNIFIEAGTPFIKREGMRGIEEIRRKWPGMIVADMKITDGALEEVNMASQAGAGAITVMGSSPTETLNLFIQTCKARGILSMVDMLGIQDPLDVLRPLMTAPDVVVLHLGRDEETSRGKLIQYQHVKRIHSKYASLISAAGGVGLESARSAIFNGANIVVANLVHPGDPWEGISTQDDIAGIVHQFLKTIA